MAKPNFHAHRIPILDFVRLLAAGYIVIHHAQFLVWSPTLSSTSPRLCLSATCLPHFFLFGHQAVLLFFILSGFTTHLISFSSLFSFPVSRFYWLSFYRHRLQKLLPGLLIAMIITTSLDNIGLKLLTPSSYQNHSLYPQLNQLSSSASNTLSQNIVSLFVNPKWPVWGTNHPLWFLRYLIIIYGCYPFLKKVYQRKPIIIFLGLTLFYLWGSFNDPSPPTIMSQLSRYLPIWWLGTLLAEIYQGRFNFPLKNINYFSFLFLPLFFNYVLPHPLPLPSSLLNLIWGGSFAGLISCCLSSTFLNHSHLINRFTNFTPIFYLLYTLHYPLLLFLSNLIITISPSHQLPQNYLIVWLCSLFCVLIVWMFHHFVAQPITKLLKYLSNLPAINSTPPLQNN